MNSEKLIPFQNINKHLETTISPAQAAAKRAEHMKSPLEKKPAHPKYQMPLSVPEQPGKKWWAMGSESKVPTFKDYYLEEASAKPFLNFYYAQEKGMEPSDKDIYECLYTLEDYYEDYLRWYDSAPHRKKDSAQKRIYLDFQKQLGNIRKALRSREPRQMIIAVDQGINQWHHDFPIVAHFAMEVGSQVEDMDEADAMEEEWYNVSDILRRLGRLPETSPYKS